MVGWQTFQNERSYGPKLGCCINLNFSNEYSTKAELVVSLKHLYAP